MWFILSVLTALFRSLNDLFSKISLKDGDEFLSAWAMRFFALFLLVPVVLIKESLILPDRIYFIALFFSGVLNTIVTVLYMKSLKYSDMSLSVPMLAFTPLFMLVTSPFIAGEFPTIYGITGIIFIFAGSYISNLNMREYGLLKPFKALLQNKGTRYMLIVALIWSFTANIDKVGVEHSSPVFWGTSVNLFMAVILSLYMLFRHKKFGSAEDVIRVIPLGILAALTIIVQMHAISLTMVAYVIAIKRCSAVMSAIFGYFILREKDIMRRLSGAVIMIIGVIIILLRG